MHVVKIALKYLVVFLFGGVCRENKAVFFLAFFYGVWYNDGRNAQR